MKPQLIHQTLKSIHSALTFNATLKFFLFWVKHIKIIIDWQKTEAMI